MARAQKNVCRRAATDRLRRRVGPVGASDASAHLTVFMTDLGEFSDINVVFARRFGPHRPARTTVQVSAVPTGAGVEINAIARRQA